ncbi:MAG: AAA family ATPase, partial [Proteobacteria bacterium]|nr:AAA family ATPase [Pseudomonadota bacterium]
EGLAIADLEQEWTSYPVLHLDLTGVNYHKPDALENTLNLALCDWEDRFGSRAAEKELGDRLMGVVRRASEQKGTPVVLLVDEYEKPILDTIGDEALQEKHCQTLNGLYGGIKKADRYLKFVLLTGVTKIGKLSVFSALNNITDISLMEEYADICGMTETEIARDFHGDIQLMADVQHKSYDEMHAELKREYNGYHFSEEMAQSVYNPYSLLNALARKKISHYWFETGTPTFLVHLLKKHRPDIYHLAGSVIQKDSLTQINSFTSNPLPIIYQSGYLTISNFDEEFSEFTLDYPNDEVREGFLKGLTALVMGEERTSEFEVSHFVRAVRRGDTDDFFERMGAMLSGVPYEIKLDYEVHFQNFIYLLFTLMGFYTNVEYHTAKGRADVVIKTDDYIYVMELKRDSSAEDAMKQIHEKGYAHPFKLDGRKLILVGANFASDMSGLDGVLVEEG